MAKKKITENENKEADVKAFVDENTGKTLSSKDIEKSKKALKKTTAEFYDADPEKKAARKKQVNDYKEYKARRIKEDEEKAKSKDDKSDDVIEDIPQYCQLGIGTEKAVEQTVEEKIEDEVKEEPVVEKVEEAKPVEPKQPVIPQITSRQAYGHCHMGIEYD